MDWLADILKNLAVSRTLVFAFFVTAVIMYFGPAVSPGHVPKLAEAYVPYLFAAMLLSGVLLVLWALSAIWGFIKHAIKRASNGISGLAPLSEAETAILFYMANNPTLPLDLGSLDYSKTPGTKLEFHQLTKFLERKGLVSIHYYDDDLISLTEQGREKALEIQRQVKNRAAA